MVAAHERTTEPGLVVSTHGRHVWVETAAHHRLICHARGKKSQTVVGDRVMWQASQDEGTIEAILPRRNLLYRQDETRTKSFAANLDQVLILIAAEPEFSERQLCRALIAAQAQHIRPVIALNKSDLAVPFARAWDRLGAYRAMGYTTLALALKPRLREHSDSTSDIDALTALLADKTTLVLGPSGSGKSTLINRLIPDAKALTNAVSTALNSGKHTTTSTNLYWVNATKTTAVIDSPGFQEFGLHHIDPRHLADWMPDIRAHASECKFYNCTHLHEPGCGVRQCVQSDHSATAISPVRYAIYGELFAELSRKRY